MAAVAAMAAGVAACGSDGASGPPTLNLYTFTAGSGGAFEAAVKSCNQRAEGRYKIVIQDLPPNADDQREQLARRLAAKDASIDIAALDVIFTGEFAEAKWILPFPDAQAEKVREGTIASTVETGTYQKKLYAAPFTSNTQLLWYRKDRVDSPPKTWKEMFDQARRLGKGKGVIEIQGAQAEGYVVWFNALVQSAGGRILSGPTKVDLADGPTRAALQVMQTSSQAPFADPSQPTQAEDEGRIAFETGGPSFMVNYPFIYPSAKENAPDVFENIGAARFPSVSASEPSAPPLGGLNLAVGAFTKNKAEAFDAAMCIREPKNQLLATELGGLPPTQESLFDDEVVRKAYPGFSGLMLESIKAAGPRPATPAYSDLSLGIQETLHPPSSVRPTEAKELRETIQDALDGKGLL